VTMSASGFVLYVALKGAPGRDGPASCDGGSGVVMQCIETVGKCRVSVEKSAGSCERMRNAWIPNKVGGW
jgi:hypothetical protein